MTALQTLDLPRPGGLYAPRPEVPVVDGYDQQLVTEYFDDETMSEDDEAYVLDLIDRYGIQALRQAFAVLDLKARVAKRWNRPFCSYTDRSR